MKTKDKIFIGIISVIVLFQISVVIYNSYEKQRRIKTFNKIMQSFSHPIDSLFLYNPQEQKVFSDKEEPSLFI